MWSAGVYALFRLISIAKYVLKSPKYWLSARGTKFKIFREHISKKVTTENHKPAVMLRIYLGGP